MLLSLLILNIAFCELAAKTSYRAASLSLTQKVDATKYVNYISQASSQKVDIMVFPELSVIQEVSEAEIVIVGSIPCSEGDSKPIQKKLSCASKEFNIFVVFDFIEEGEKCVNGTEYCHGDHYYYNTAVILNPEGKIIEKYRKKHPYKSIWKPGNSGLVTFSTDFGVEFGVFVCYDIMFTVPADHLVREKKVNNFVFPTMWDDAVLILDALQAQQSWSEFYGVNLIASNNVHHSNGVGIFSNGKPLKYNEDRTNDVLLIADVPLFDFEDPPEVPISKIPWKNETIVKEFKVVDGQTDTLSLETASGNCNLKYKVSKGNEHFRLISSRYPPTYDDKVLVDTCGILNCGNDTEHCLNLDPKTIFEDLEITMIVNDNIRAVMPLISAKNLDLYEPYDDFVIVHDEDKHSIYNTKTLTNPIQNVFNMAVLFDDID